MTVLAAMTVAASPATSGCGIRTDDRPRALPVAPTSTAPATTTVPSGPLESVVWYVEDQNLVPAGRPVADRSLSTVLSALIDPSANLEGDLSNSIPIGTELLGVEQSASGIRIDLSGAFDELAGTSRQLALGQLVLTATQDRDVEEVRFLVDGEPVRASTPERGDVDAATVCDFVSLLPTGDELAGESLAPATLDQLVRRRAEVEAECG